MFVNYVPNILMKISKSFQQKRKKARVEKKTLKGRKRYIRAVSQAKQNNNNNDEVKKVNKEKKSANTGTFFFN